MYEYEPGGSPTPCWKSLAALEPALLGLEDDLRSAVTRNHFDCIDQLWHRGGFKRRMERLVGWQAAHPALSTGDAYDAVYRHLWSILESYERPASRAGM
jgi:hypothetical protein